MEHLQTPPTDTQWDTMREIEGIGFSLAGKDREPTDIAGALVPHIRVVRRLLPSAADLFTPITDEADENISTARSWIH